MNSLVGTTILAVVLAIASGPAGAQSEKFPNPSRTVYKCEIEGKVAYSDSPCLGAQRIDVEPTRGLNKSTGKERTGKDVAREKQKEGFAEAIQPITGMNPKEHETYTRRFKLVPEAQRECKLLDAAIPGAELEEKKATKQSLPAAQTRLFGLRKMHRELGC